MTQQTQAPRAFDSSFLPEFSDLATPRILALAGTLGSGKTTFISNLLRRSREDLTPLIIIENDVGKMNVDAALFERAEEEVVALTAGCICCADVNSLALELQRIRENRSDIRTIVIETTGLAHPEAVREVLSASELPFLMAVSIDVANFRDNLALGRLKSHVEAADLLVGTHWNSPADDEETRRDKALEVLAYINERNPRARTVFVDENGNTAQLHGLLAQAEGEFGTSKLIEGEAPVLRKGTQHGVFAKSVQFGPEASLDDLKRLALHIESQGGSLLRAKGIIGNELVQLVHGRVTSRTPQEGSAALNLISTIALTPALLRGAFGDAVQLSSKPAANNVTILGGVDLLEARKREVTRLTAGFPKEVLIDRNGRKSLLVDFEADQAEEFAAQEGMPREIATAYFEASLRARLAGYRILSSELLPRDESKLPFYMRRVGSALAWILDGRREFVDSYLEGIERDSLRPASMYFRGCLEVTQPEQIEALTADGVKWVARLIDICRAEIGASEAATLCQSGLDNVTAHDRSGTWSLHRDKLREKFR